MALAMGLVCAALGLSGGLAVDLARLAAAGAALPVEHARRGEWVRAERERWAAESDDGSFRDP
jgi:hypothetical protein